MLNRIHIRWRLALLIMTLVAMVIIASSILMDQLWHAELYEQLDRSLHGEVNEFAAAAAGAQIDGGAVDTQDIANLALDIGQLYQFEEPTRIVLFRLTDAHTLSLNVAVEGEIAYDNLPLPNDSQTKFETLALIDGEPYRVAYAPILVAGQTAGTLYVADPTAPLEEVIAAQVRNTVLAAVVGLAAAGAVSYLIARTSLTPIQRITQTADSITKEDLSRRIGYDGPQDEVGELAAAFDSMIGRLDQAFREQRSLMTDLSHEIRTPITLIRGHLELWHAHPDRHSADAGRSISAAIEELDRMNRLVGNLLLLAKTSSSIFLQPAPLYLPALIGEIMNKTFPLGDRKWVLGELPPCMIFADEDYLTSAILNLLQNAVQHTQPGDSIGLDAKLRATGISISVWDTGHGIPPEDLPYVFDRFYRSRQTPGADDDGTGLGLAIVKAVMIAHGGSVGVDAEVGKGSTFTIQLPVSRTVTEDSRLGAGVSGGR